MTYVSKALRDLDAALAKRRMPFVYNDGGRAAAGFKGKARGDCACRAIAIATGKPYQEVYDDLNAAGKADGKSSAARTGVYNATILRYMKSLGWAWTPTRFGPGCKVNWRADELPAGTLIASLSSHTVTVIDGVAHDISDPWRTFRSRDGTRCVYGYYTPPEKSKPTPCSQIAIRMTPEQFNEVTEVCARLAISKNEFVLQALRYAIDNLEEED